MNNKNKKDNLHEGPNWDSAPKPKGVAALTLGKETKVYIPGVGWQFPATARKWAKEKGYTNWQDIPNPPQPKPDKPKPPKQRLMTTFTVPTSLRCCRLN